MGNPQIRGVSTKRPMRRYHPWAGRVQGPGDGLGLGLWTLSDGEKSSVVCASNARNKLEQGPTQYYS
jgi:hypothetical protein